eukprot:364776-Chlamydomonas_euryale.AAC.2
MDTVGRTHACCASTLCIHALLVCVTTSVQAVHAPCPLQHHLHSRTRTLTAPHRWMLPASIAARRHAATRANASHDLPACTQCTHHHPRSRVLKAHENHSDGHVDSRAGHVDKQDQACGQQGRTCGQTGQGVWTAGQGMWTNRTRRVDGRAGHVDKQDKACGQQGRACGQTGPGVWTAAKGMWTNRTRRVDSRAGHVDKQDQACGQQGRASGQTGPRWRIWGQHASRVARNHRNPCLAPGIPSTNHAMPTGGDAHALPRRTVKLSNELPAASALCPSPLQRSPWAASPAAGTSVPCRRGPRERVGYATVLPKRASGPASRQGASSSLTTPSNGASASALRRRRQCGGVRTATHATSCTAAATEAAAAGARAAPGGLIIALCRLSAGTRARATAGGCTKRRCRAGAGGLGDGRLEEAATSAGPRSGGHGLGGCQLHT